VAKTLKYLEGFVQPGGGIHVKDSFYANYETCLALVALNAANKDGRYTKTIKAAEKFVRGEQWDDAKGHDRSSVYFGGAGYGKKKRPDLSNTSFFVDTLKTLGAGPDDPNIQAALVFVSRCQNLESEHNTTPHAAKTPDGSFYYTPVGQGESFAGTTTEGGLRGYASMTYAGLKSMIYAGLSKDDARVKAALGWIRKNYDVKSNPGLGRRGLYYYYHTFAKALAAAGIDEIEDAQGVKRNWRQDLLAELRSTQQNDGSWVNKNDSRWMEDDANLVTSYVLLALKYARP
jgi:squalene-hopene/tetraprenyl-beta-curcumene cyclase